MRERINRLAKGIIDSEIPVLEIAPSSIEAVVRAGSATRREIIITSENNLNIKGLIYSSNSRVRVLNNSFGGLRNHVAYEIDSKYLEDGDTIKGSFYLVTNGGEKEIPYSLCVELGTSGKTLGSLETPKDFAGIAFSDMDTALRLFEYQDFTEAPFMKDIHVRTLYDGLKGRPDRKNQLEEFLVALKVKEPVELTIDTEKLEYENPLEITEEKILIKKSNWGYLNIEAKADGEFIEIHKKTITDNDFKEDKYELPFKIHPQKLHKGKNFGCIILAAAKKTFVIPIEAMGDETVDISEGDKTYFKDGFNRYAKLRLDYESGLYEPSLLVNKMTREVERLQNVCGKQDLLTLLYVELAVMNGRTEQAAAILNDCQDSILRSRQDQLDNYCFYQYLNLQVHPNEGQRESLIRLLIKYMEEEKKHHILFLLLLKLDNRLGDNPGALLASMRRQYKNGCCSPFLYVQACKLLEKEKTLLRSVDAFELQTLYFGAKEGIISQELAMQAAKLANMSKHFNKLYYRLLVKLYDQYPEKEMLSAICGMLIKGECRQPEAFIWYQKGLEAGLSLTRLYEYYLYALPTNYDQLLPTEVLLYFSYGNELDRETRSALYTNILNYMKPDMVLYKDYERDIEKFAMEQLFESRINSRLAVIYDHMIYKDVIDVPMAKVLPSILRSYRVECDNKRMKYVVVCYDELVEADAYLLDQGVAYVPLFSEHSILLFQDAYGNRYGSIPYEKKAVMRKPELEQRCYQIYPDHPMLRMKECEEIIERGIESEDEAVTLERSLDEIRLHPLYQKIMLSCIIEYYQKKTLSDDISPDETGGSYLICLDKTTLTKEERLGICETLITQNYTKEAYEMIREYGCEGIKTKRLLKLCTRTILQRLFDQDDLLLVLAYGVFSEGKCDSVILDYLCEHFNGTTDQMYKVLMQGICDHVETYDLEERLVAQMLFSGTTERIDKVFDLYVTRKKTGDNIVKAYFTIKSADYFLEDKTPDDKVFSYLEGAVHGSAEKEKVPTIYLLALTKYYSTLPSMKEEQVELCRSTVDILLEEGMVFPYFKSLAKFISMPDEIMDKSMIQYNSSKDAHIDLQIRILPDEEEYHSEEMKRVYQGVFIKQKILFEGELMEYRVFERLGEEWILKVENSVVCEVVAGKNEESRFGCLNEMGLCLNLKEDERLRKKMEEYLIKNATVEGLFQLM